MDAPAATTEAELIEGAATGDRAALADLASYCISRQFSGITPFEAMVMAEAFGRLAAAHGDPADNILLAGILRIRAHHVEELGDQSRAECLLMQSELLCEEYPSPPLSRSVEFLAGVLTAEADSGCDLAAMRLGKLSAALSASDADRLRYALNDACREYREAQEAASVDG